MLRPHTTLTIIFISIIVIIFAVSAFVWAWPCQKWADSAVMVRRLMCRTIQGAETLKRVYTSHTAEFVWLLLNFLAWRRNNSSSSRLPTGRPKEWRRSDGVTKERCSLPCIKSLSGFSCFTAAQRQDIERTSWGSGLAKDEEARAQWVDSTLGVNLPVWSTGAWKVKKKYKDYQLDTSSRWICYYIPASGGGRDHIKNGTGLTLPVENDSTF